MLRWRCHHWWPLRRGGCGADPGVRPCLPRLGCPETRRRWPELKAGEVVLDLGSGGGIDVLLSAKRVGPTGFAWGLDMTDEMLALAERNKVTGSAA